MTDATYFGRAFKPQQQAHSAELELPAPQPFAAPVFIHDCVIPCRGETLLSLLMKRMMQEAEAGDHPTDVG